MLSEREHLALADIGQQLRGSDPELARSLERGRPRRGRSVVAMLGAGLALMTVGWILMSVTVAVLGFTIVAATPLVAHYRASGPALPPPFTGAPTP